MSSDTHELGYFLKRAVRTGSAVAFLLLVMLGTMQAANVDSRIAAADDACSSLAGVITAHVESDYLNQVPQWKDACEHHPLRNVCESTAKFIELNIGRPVLDCARAGH